MGGSLDALRAQRVPVGSRPAVNEAEAAAWADRTAAVLRHLTTDPAQPQSTATAAAYNQLQQYQQQQFVDASSNWSVSKILGALQSDTSSDEGAAAAAAPAAAAATPAEAISTGLSAWRDPIGRLLRLEASMEREGGGGGGGAGGSEVAAASKILARLDAAARRAAAADTAATAAEAGAAADAADAGPAREAVAVLSSSGSGGSGGGGGGGGGAGASMQQLFPAPMPFLSLEASPFAPALSSSSSLKSTSSSSSSPPALVEVQLAAEEAERLSKESAAVMATLHDALLVATPGATITSTTGGKGAGGDSSEGGAGSAVAYRAAIGSWGEVLQLAKNLDRFLLNHRKAPASSSSSKRKKSRGHGEDEGDEDGHGEDDNDDDDEDEEDEEDEEDGEVRRLRRALGRLIGEASPSTACMRSGLPSVPHCISSSMSNLGAIVDATICFHSPRTSGRANGGCGSSTAPKSRFETEMRMPRS